MSHTHSIAAADDSIVRRLRREQNLTQADLADRAGLERVTIGRIERGEVRPRHATRLALAAALACRPGDLRGDR